MIKVLFALIVSVFVLYACVLIGFLYYTLEEDRETSVLKFYGIPLVIFSFIFYLIYSFVL